MIKKESVLKNIMLIFVLCIFAYMPALFNSYMAHDDYWFQQISEYPVCRNSTMYNSFVGVGRILAAESICLWTSGLHSYMTEMYTKKRGATDYYTLMRAANIVVIILTFLMLWLWFNALVDDRDKAFIITGLIMLLPGITVYAAWGSIVVFAPGFISLIISVYSMSQVMRVSDDVFKLSILLHSFKRLILFAISSLFLIITFHFHPGIAFMFLLIPMSLLVFTDRAAWMRRKIEVIFYYFMFGLSTVIYFITNKFIFMPIFRKKGDISIDIKKFEFSNIEVILGNIQQFFKYSVWRILNLWRISDDFTFAHIIEVFLYVTIFVVSVMFWTKGNKNNRRMNIEKTILAFIILATSCAIPMFYMPVYYYRVLLVISAMVVLLVVWAVSIWISLIKRFFSIGEDRKFQILPHVGLVIVVILGAFARYYINTDYVAVQQREITVLEEGLQPLFKGDLDAVFVVGVGFGDNDLTNPHFSGDEFGLPSSGFPGNYSIPRMVVNTALRYGQSLAEYTFTDSPITKVFLVTRKNPIDKANQCRSELTDLPLESIKAASFSSIALDRLFYSDQPLTVWHTQPPYTFSDRVDHRIGIIDIDYAFFPDLGKASLLDLQMESIKASSILGSLGTDKLFGTKITYTAWHTQSPPVYPEWLNLTFQRPVSFKKLVLTPQYPRNIFIARAPRQYAIKISDNGIDWKELAYVDDVCKVFMTDNNVTELPETITTKFVRLELYSNCGDKHNLSVLNIRLF
ncbi:MAG: discoidin domain-containing protein [Nitrospirae bacterium]|nr:discoidin domain-containing protein [Nitrospirota bacterium]